MTWKHFKEVPLYTSDLGEITGVEEEGGNNPKNIDNNSTNKKGTKDISDTERCSISGKDKVEYIGIQTISYYKGFGNCDEKSQASSSNMCFMMSSSLVAIAIICFITGSYLAVRTKTNTDIISPTGR